MKYNLYNDDCFNVLKQLEESSIDLTVTSPPYDNLRTYNNNSIWNFEIFKNIANELYKITKIGGVIIWVVNDAVIKGSETGTSFKQALYFNNIGFNIHDTMIYKKLNFMPQNKNRYEQCFEYIFCFSKGKPKTFNPIRIPCKYAGTKHWGVSSSYNKDGELKINNAVPTVIKETKVHENIFEYRTGSITSSAKINHPAMFPYDLALDQIISWSNENEIVLDPFMGSGTTGIASIKSNRNFIGIEIDKNYFNIAKERIENTNITIKKVKIL